MRNLFVTLLITLLAGTVWAADNNTHGQPCDSDIVIMPKKGEWRSYCTNICNNFAASDTVSDACTEFKFVGLPDIIILERELNDANCAGDITFTFTTGPTSGGTVDGNPPAYALDTSPVVLNDATQRIVFPMASGPFDSYLFTAVATATSCTDVDVRMYTITKED
jgi:hypothetical protein